MAKDFLFTYYIQNGRCYEALKYLKSIQPGALSFSRNEDRQDSGIPLIQQSILVGNLLSCITPLEGKILENGERVLTSTQIVNLPVRDTEESRQPIHTSFVKTTNDLRTHEKDKTQPLMLELMDYQLGNSRVTAPKDHDSKAGELKNSVPPQAHDSNRDEISSEDESYSILSHLDSLEQSR